LLILGLILFAKKLAALYCTAYAKTVGLVQLANYSDKSAEFGCAIPWVTPKTAGDKTAADKTAATKQLVTK